MLVPSDAAERRRSEGTLLGDVVPAAVPGPGRQTAPYGSWASPITARLIAESGVALGGLQTASRSLFWLEARPLDGGRTTLVRGALGGEPQDVTPAGTNVRTLVHEYGGGAYTLHERPDGRVTVLFSEFADQRLYRLDLDARKEGSGSEAAAPSPITPEPPAYRSLRYADGCVSADGRTLFCVRERHERHGVINELVALDTGGEGEAAIVAGGHDFFAAPRLSPDGSRLAWLCWDHPLMPWDGTELWVADVAGRELTAQRRVAGGPSESILQPAWSADGRLHFVSDRSGWWNLYRVEESGATSALAPAEAELAGPPWSFGLHNYRFLPDGRIIAFRRRDGADHLVLIGADAEARGDEAPNAAGEPDVTPVPCELTAFGSLAVIDKRVAAVAGSPTRSAAVVIVDLPRGGVREIRRGTAVDIDPGYLSPAQSITFATSYEPGSIGGPLAAELERAASESASADPGALEAHALYYAPANRDFRAPADERPPLIVMSHGGPTSSAGATLSLGIQFWTSRGFAVVDVDYGGSSGYGRAYRERLKGNWGIVDTVDCINAARFLAARGDVDPARLAVTGGSAGGYTTLNALTRHDVFAAGASYFGVADLEAFAAGGTHKFESQYLSGLIGPYPEQAATYRERSPIDHVAGIACPVILFQGLEDAIVPPAQSEVIVAALARNGLPHAYLAFPGEQHGFRAAGNIVRSTEAELYFYGRVFGFTPADDIEPVEIKNLR